MVHFNFLIIFFSCGKKRQTIRKMKYCYITITITYKNTKNERHTNTTFERD